MFDISMLLPVWILGLPLIGGLVEAVRANSDAKALPQVPYGATRRPNAAITAA